MKLNILILLLLVLSGCSSSRLMRCPTPAPDNVYHCPKAIEGDFRMCKEADNDFQCVSP